MSYLNVYWLLFRVDKKITHTQTLTGYKETWLYCREVTGYQDKVPKTLGSSNIQDLAGYWPPRCQIYRTRPTGGSRCRAPEHFHPMTHWTLLCNVSRGCCRYAALVDPHQQRTQRRSRAPRLNVSVSLKGCCAQVQPTWRCWVAWSHRALNRHWRTAPLSCEEVLYIGWQTHPRRPRTDPKACGWTRWTLSSQRTGQNGTFPSTSGT